MSTSYDKKQGPIVQVVCGRCLSSTRTRRPMEWKREIARSALSLARSAQVERNNESCFFVRAAGVHRFIKRYHVKKRH
ncbi:hypothetical protein EVAR_64629_1 [Eumeta japonica]|uniref:Uncharacterized protein n=1 Tax=Eumeta variegata TaxID=151549 RepID=A0A4C1ZCC5_EUMVA|nr:hypothetical protein EVAR_64629_1 [Eumeta japonica]